MGAILNNIHWSCTWSKLGVQWKSWMEWEPRTALLRKNISISNKSFFWNRNERQLTFNKAADRSKNQSSNSSVRKQSQLRQFYGVWTFKTLRLFVLKDKLCTRLANQFALIQPADGSYIIERLRAPILVDVCMNRGSFIFKLKRQRDRTR